MVQLSLLGNDETALGSSFENLFEVELLANVSHINNSITLQLVDSIPNSGQIRGRIPESSIRLLHNEGRCLLFANEDADCSLILDSVSLLFKFGNKWLEEWVIEALSHFLELDVHAIVQLLELFS